MNWLSLFKVIGEVLVRLLDYFKEKRIREDEQRRRKEGEDAAIDAANRVPGGRELPDDPRDYRDE